jgi:hypothetical protein
LVSLQTPFGVLIKKQFHSCHCLSTAPCGSNVAGLFGMSCLTFPM